jgi:hypothetical protein
MKKRNGRSWRPCGRHVGYYRHWIRTSSSAAGRKKANGFGIAFYRIFSSTDDLLFNEKSFAKATT